MALQCLNPLEQPAWNATLRPHPGATIFHTAEWAAVLHATYGGQPLGAVRIAAGAGVRACVPLLDVRSWLTGRRGVSLPFSDFCEPLLLPPEPLPGLADELFELGRGLGWRSLEVRGGRALFADAEPSLRYLGHTLALSRDVEALRARLKPAVRTAIRKAERAGVEAVTATSLEAVREFYALHALTRRSHGLPPQPFAFFRNLQRHVLARDLGFVALARLGGTAVAGAVFLHFGANALFKFGASDPRHLAFRPNDLLLWRGIQRYAERGFAALSLGKTKPEHEGLLRFKRGWGAAEAPIEYFKRDLRRNAFVRDDDRVSGWHTAVFRRLPLFASRAVGSLLYRHMA